MVFPYLLSLIFNIYVVLYSVLFPFVHSVYLAIFILLCLFFISDKVLHLPIQKIKNQWGAISAKSNPWLGCVYKDRRGEERWGMGWGVTLPLFGCFEGERIWGDFIISWIEADLLSDFVWMDKYFGCSYFIDLLVKATTIGCSYFIHLKTILSNLVC